MELPLLCVVAAAARAAVFLDRPDVDDRRLEPHAPELDPFRRMAYLWQDGQALLPIGDRLRLWLDFLRAQGTTAVQLRIEGRAGVVLTSTPAAAWRVLEEEGDARMLGAAAGGADRETRAPGEPAPPSPSEPADPAAELRRALEGAARHAPTEAQARLGRALAILDAADGGSAPSDAAWLYSVLPDDSYTPADRRLVAAAVTAWPEAAAGALLDAAGAALMAVVNSAAGRQPVK